MKTMKVPSAKEKDFVLRLYFNRDIKGIEPPKEADCPPNLREIEAILNDDGYVEPNNNGYLVINTKGRAFLGKGGYTAVRNKAIMKYCLSYVSGAFTVILAWLLSRCS